MAIDKEALVFFIKQKYPHIFGYEIKGEYFIFRPLTRYEFEQIVMNPNVSKDVASETICELCTIYPENYNFEECKFAGIPENLSNEIIEKSGWDNEEMIENILQKLQQKNEDLDFQLENRILNAFPPQITPEEMRHWDIYTFLDYVVRANMVLKEKIPMPLAQAPGPGPTLSSRPGVEQEIESTHTFVNNKYA